MNKRIIGIILIVMLMSVGCGTNTVNSATNADESQVTEETKKEFSFEFGEGNKTIEVPSEPKKIVVIGYDLIDIVDQLGHKDKIVGVPDPANPMFPDFLEGYEAVESVGSLMGDDLEAIAGLQPDLILAGARTFAAYENLSEIAPTAYFTIPGMNETNFEAKLLKNIDEVAFLLNETDSVEVVKKEISNSIAKLKELVVSLEDSSTLFLIVTGKTVNVYTDNPESRYGFVYNEFGFDAVAGVEEIADEDKKVNDGEASRHGNSISYEFISSKDPNYIIVIDKGATTGRGEIAATDTLDNPLVNMTKAAKNQQIIYLDGEAWYLATGGIESTKLMVKSLMDAVVQ